jgi:hypothetical protein
LLIPSPLAGIFASHLHELFWLHFESLCELTYRRRVRFAVAVLEPPKTAQDEATAELNRALDVLEGLQASAKTSE